MTSPSAAFAREKGNELFRAGHFEEALQFYEAALQQGPQPDLMVVCTFNAGQCRRRLGHMSEAIDQFRKTLVLQPSHAKAHFLLAQTLEATNRFEDALHEYEAHVAVNAATNTPEIQAVISDLRERVRLAAAVSAGSLPTPLTPEKAARCTAYLCYFCMIWSHVPTHGPPGEACRICLCKTTLVGDIDVPEIGNSTKAQLLTSRGLLPTLAWAGPMSLAQSWHDIAFPPQSRPPDGSLGYIDLVTRNRNELAQPKMLGICLYCFHACSPGAITEWCDDGMTALCPHCSIDSILPLKHNLLKASMYRQIAAWHRHGWGETQVGVPC